MSADTTQQADSAKGQILPGTPFGQLLADLAAEHPRVVEIGAWHGQGSTLCLASGLRQNGRLTSVELNPDRAKEARDFWSANNGVEVLCGYVAQPKYHSYLWPKPDHEAYKHDLVGTLDAVNVLDKLPERIGLCLFDGGDYCGVWDWFKLVERCEVVALDDICANKNWLPDRIMSGQPDRWECVRRETGDRHGWAVYRRRKA